MDGSTSVGDRSDCHISQAINDLAAAGDIGMFAAIGPVPPQESANRTRAAGAVADGFAEGGAVEPFTQRKRLRLGSGSQLTACAPFTAWAPKASHVEAKLAP